MSDFSNRLKNIMEQQEIRPSDLSRKTGIGKSSISAYLSGGHEPKQNNILKISNALGVSITYLMGWEDPSNNTKEFKPTSKGVRIPVLGTVVAGIPIEAITDIIDWEEITNEMARHGEHYGLKVKGDSMFPRIHNNDTIIFRKQPDVENGQVAIVTINGDEATCKKVMKSEHGITLIAFNQAVYEPTFYSNKEIQELPIVILGVVVEVRGTFL